MSTQASVRSIDALKDFRTALALYGEDTVAALGAVEAEVRRTLVWLQQDRPAYWQQQIKLRRERVAAAKAELFRKKLAQTETYRPSLADPMEALRKAEASLLDAERRIVLVKKWQQMFIQVMGDYHASTRRIRDLAASDVPRAVSLLTRIIDALEAYVSLAPPSGRVALAEATTAPPELEAIAVTALNEPAAATPEPGPRPAPEAEEDTHIDATESEIR